MERGMIELADMIGELRGELRRAIVTGVDEDLRFELDGPGTMTRR